jgi:hypothetical protein
MVSPFTVALMDEAVATKVPQTGSFFNSPPDCSRGGAAGREVTPVTWENARMMSTITCRMKTAAIKTIISRNTLRNNYFFFPFLAAGASGFLYSVEIWPLIMESMPFDDSA